MMNRVCLVNRVACLTAGVAAIGVGVASAALAPSIRVSTDREAAIFATIKEIREIRHVSYVPPKDDEMSFSMSDEPGLRLTLDLALPSGRKLVDIAQPSRVAATDAAGTDLSAIEPGFMGDIEYVEVSTVYNFDEENTHEVHFHLATPRRDAATFSLETVLDVTTHTGTKEATSKVTTEWTTLDAGDFDGQAVRVRLTNPFDDSIGVEISPGSAAAFIDEARLGVEGDELDNSGSMSDGNTITYFFQGEADPEQGIELRLKIRTGMETTPVEIVFKDQPLP